MDVNSYLIILAAALGIFGLFADDIIYHELKQGVKVFCVCMFVIAAILQYIKDYNEKEEQESRFNASILKANTTIEKANLTIDKLQTAYDSITSIQKLQKTQQRLQERLNNVSKNILEKNVLLVNTQKSILNGIKRQLNPISPINLTVSFSIPLKTGFTNFLEKEAVALKEKYSPTRDTLIVTNVDSVFSKSAIQEYDNYILSLIVLTKEPLEYFDTLQVDQRVNGLVFVTGIPPTIPWYFPNKGRAPYSTISKFLKIDYKTSHIDFIVIYTGLKTNSASGNMVTNDIGFDELDGHNFLISTLSDVRDSFVTYKNIVLEAEGGSRRAYIFFFNKRHRRSIQEKYFYYHKLSKNDFKLPELDINLVDF